MEIRELYIKEIVSFCLQYSVGRTYEYIELKIYFKGRKGLTELQNCVAMSLEIGQYGKI